MYATLNLGVLIGCYDIFRHYLTDLIRATDNAKDQFVVISNK